MTWLFSKALMDSVNLPSSLERVEEYSAANCSDGEQSAQLNVMPTQHKFWRNDKTMESSRLSQFGLTCAVLTGSRGEELLMSYLEGFPAKTSAQPEKEQESQESAADYGRSSQGLLAKYDRATCSWKTAQYSLLEDLELSLETWPKWGSMQNGECWGRQPLVQYMQEKGFGLLPTPTTTDYKGSVAPKSIMARITHPRGVRLEEHLKRGLLLPTMNAGSSHWSGRLDELGGKGDPFRGLEIGKLALNPSFVEEMMGWPIGWTDLKPLATDKYRFAPQQHSDYLCTERAGIRTDV